MSDKNLGTPAVACFGWPAIFMRNHALGSWKLTMKVLICLPNNKNDCISLCMLLLLPRAREQVKDCKPGTDHFIWGMCNTSWWMKWFSLFSIKTLALFLLNWQKILQLLTWTRTSVKNVAMGLSCRKYCFLINLPGRPIQFPKWKKQSLQQRSYSRKQFISFVYGRGNYRTWSCSQLYKMRKGIDED